MHPTQEHLNTEGGGDIRDADSVPGSGRFPGGGNSTPVFLPRKFHG